MSDPAVFVDRDNTLIKDPGFIDRPEQVELLPGTADALSRMRACGYRLIVVSNQSGVARGLIREEQLAQVHDRLRELLAAQGVVVDAIYACPYLDGDQAVVRKYRRDSPLRKPRPGMLLQAACERDLDLARSWMIGDRATDVEAGAAAGCHTILVASEPPPYNGRVEAEHVVASLMEAARIVEEHQEPSRPPVPASDQHEDRTLELLGEIRDALERQHRGQRQEDFSFLRLVGALMQMLAVVAAVWGLVGIFGDAEVAAIPRFALAIFLQLLAVTIRYYLRGS